MVLDEPTTKEPMCYCYNVLRNDVEEAITHQLDHLHDSEEFAHEVLALFDISLE